MLQTAFTISTDKSVLDIPMIHQYLSQESYWAKGRSLDAVKTTVEHSFCFGVYTANEQIGFARVVTDYAIFGWIMDVFILPKYRGQGASKLLLQTILSHEKLAALTRWGLMTHDAHGLYQQFGFRENKNPEYHMEFLPPKH